jgi:catechol 2,3-dioxygenase-like lactoylglutathione lyase family enzyme
VPWVGNRLGVGGWLARDKRDRRRGERLAEIHRWLRRRCRLRLEPERWPLEHKGLKNEIVSLGPARLIIERRAIKHTLVWSQHKSKLRPWLIARTSDTPTVMAPGRSIASQSPPGQVLTGRALEERGRLSSVAAAGTRPWIVVWCEVALWQGVRMPPYISHTTVDCGNAYEQSEWWKQVLGYVNVADDPNEPGDEECMILSPETGHHILFIEVPEPKHVKNRIHLDLRPTERTRDEEVEHLKGLGANQVADHRDIRNDGTGWVVLADPEGNEFCILRGDAERTAGSEGQ